MNIRKVLVKSIIALAIAVSLFVAVASVAFFAIVYYGGPAYNDWCYELPNGYLLSRLNISQIVLDDSSGTRIIGAYITHFCCDGRYVGVKRINCDESGALEIKIEEVDWESVALEYYLFDTQSRTLLGPYSEAEYTDIIMRYASDMPAWMATSLRPNGAY